MTDRDWLDAQIGETSDRLDRLRRLRGLVPDPAPTPEPDPLAPVLGLPFFGEPWTVRVDGMPVLADSAARIARYEIPGMIQHLNNVFGYEYPPGSGIAQGIPFNLAGDGLAPVHVTRPAASWMCPVPRPPVVESPPDRHLIVADLAKGRLWEFWGFDRASYVANSGAQWDLTRPHAVQRDQGQDSATASGLPILPGLVRWHEVRDALAPGGLGYIPHALAMTYPNGAQTPGWYKPPATATPNPSDPDPRAVPMGARPRLAADRDLSKLGPMARVIARTLQLYGSIVTDGTDRDQGWSLIGVPDPRWDAADLLTLRSIPATALELVDDGLWGPAWRVDAPATAAPGQVVNLTVTLLHPAPPVSSIAAVPAGPGHFEPWAVFLAAGKTSGVIRWTVPVDPPASDIAIHWSPNDWGRKKPAPTVVKVAAGAAPAAAEVRP